MADMEKKDAAQASASAAQPQKSETPAKAEKKDKSAKKDKKPGFGARVSRWFREMRSELKKVSWPSAKDVVKNVGIVLACVIIVGLVLGVFDTLVRAVVDALLKLF